jgi:hypothetical protein
VTVEWIEKQIADTKGYCPPEAQANAYAALQHAVLQAIAEGRAEPSAQACAQAVLPTLYADAEKQP